MTIEFLGPPQLIKQTPHGASTEERISNWIGAWDRREQIDVGLVGVAFAKGGEIATGTSSTPNAIRKAFVRNTTYSHDYSLDMRHLRVGHAGDIEYHATDIARSHHQIESALRSLRQQHPSVFFLVIGGDGSIVAPSVRAAVHAGGSLGLIHFDGYHDVRDLGEVGPSDSTSVRTLLDEGVVTGRNVAQVGVHGFVNAPAEREFLDVHGAMVITAREVRRLGMDACLDRALAAASDGTDGVYVSVDANVLDAADLPFSYASMPGGLRTEELLDALFRLGADRRVAAMDFVGLDTYDDPKEMMARIGSSIVLAFLAGYSRRQAHD